mgnify:CR=1 FL=1
MHIRPKNEFYDDFFNSLDSFQNVLLNRKTTPKYTATFEVTSENSFGYETKLKKFTFPITYGNYNSNNTIWELKKYDINDNQRQSIHINNNIRYAKIWNKYARCTYTCN